MIYLQRIDRHNWLVQYRNELHRINTRAWLIFKRRKDRVKLMRLVIARATHLNTRHLRFVDNVRINGQWSSQWIEVD